MRFFDVIGQDLRYAFRLLVQNPAFAAIAILSLALGIGANTAIFTLINTVLLRSLPVRDPESLVVFALNPDKPSVSSNYPDYEYIRDHNKSFSGVVATSGGGNRSAMEVPSEGAGAGAQLVTPTLVSGNYFDVLGVTPALGRVFSSEDNKKEDAHPVAVLDYSFWQRRFGGDPRVVGLAITLNGSPFSIVGVARSGFEGTVVGNHPDIYLPIMMLRSIERGVRQWNSRHFWWLTDHGRLKPGVTHEAAIRKPMSCGSRSWRMIPRSARARLRQGLRTAESRDASAREHRLLVSSQPDQEPLQVLMIIVGLVLLIACANVANLLLASGGTPAGDRHPPGSGCR
jgi:predicted permease